MRNNNKQATKPKAVRQRRLFYKIRMENEKREKSIDDYEIRTERTE